MTTKYQLRLALTLSASVASLIAAAPVMAQTTGDSAQIEEIVVTAQRREERLQDVPIAVTAANAEGLAVARVDNIVNIRAISPSITFVLGNNAASSSNIQIRGIGTVGNSRTFEGAVGVFVDGVYRTRSGQALQNFLDIDNLQVLRGPQGTLFGKNTSAGAFLVTSARPDPGEFSGTYEATAGNYNSGLVRGAVNIPLSKKAALRIAGLWTSNDGYIKDPNTGEDYNDHHSKALKAQLLVQPTDTLEFRLIADWSRERENCCYGTVDAISGPTQPLIDALTLAQGLSLPSSNWQDYEQVLNHNPDQKIEDRGVALYGSWDTPLGGTLNFTTAYRKWNLAQKHVDPDFSGADIFSLDESFKNKFFSQEFTYNGKVGATPLFTGANYVFGVYYSSEDILAARDLYWGSEGQAYWNAILGAAGLPAGTAYAAPGLWAAEVMPASGKSYAAFTHWTFELNDKVTLIAGLRASKEEKEGAFYNSYYRPQPNDVFRLLGVQPGPAYDRSHTDNAVSGTLGLQYRFSPDTMAYATYSRGFKAGGVNIDSNAAGTVANNPAITPGAVLLDPTFKPEFIDGYEVGLKLDYLNGRARTNLALFYDKMEDLQVAQFLGLQFMILNAPSAKVYGAEIENTFKLNNALTLSAAGTWLPEAKFGTSTLLGAPLSGRRFSQSPKYAGNLALLLDKNLNSSFAVTGRIAVQYQSEILTDTATNNTQDGYSLVNLSLGVKSLTQGWSLEGWCQNCSDERYFTAQFSTPLQTGDVNAYVGAPRTYGVTLRGRF